MGVAAKHDNIAFCKKLPHLIPCLAVLVLPMVVPVAVFASVIRENRRMTKDEGVSCTLCFLEKPFHGFVVRLVEIHSYEGIRTDTEGKVQPLHLGAELLGKPFRHEFYVAFPGFGVFLAPEVVISCNRYKRCGSHCLFQIFESIRKHLCLCIHSGCVALDYVSGLVNQSGILIHEAGSSFDQPRTSVSPHFGIPGELLAVVCLPCRVRIRVPGMIICVRSGVIMRVSKDDYRIVPILASFLSSAFFPAQCLSCISRRS